MKRILSQNTIRSHPRSSYLFFHIINSAECSPLLTVGHNLLIVEQYFIHLIRESRKKCKTISGKFIGGLPHFSHTSRLKNIKFCPWDLWHFEKLIIKINGLLAHSKVFLCRNLVGYTLHYKRKNNKFNYRGQSFLA